MGEAKRRKDAGAYPTQDGFRPSTARALGERGKPGCPKCHGTGEVGVMKDQDLGEVRCPCPCVGRQIAKRERAFDKLRVPPVANA